MMSPLSPGADCVQIAATFQRHYDYYSKVGNETRLQQLKDEQSIKLQYGGRATFELLQNAFDRAEKHVLIAHVESMGDGPGRLIVGNDGKPFGFDSCFDYDAHVIDGTNRRSDFHALCSLHTSNKLPDESIGNKGVGFRSVFSLSNHVRVFSRLPDSSAWWGIELHVSLHRKLMIERLKCNSVAEGWKRFLDDRELPLNDEIPRPSFYFPFPLWAEDAIAGLPQADGLVTFVEVPLESEESDRRVRNALAELEKSHFLFVGLRESKRGVTVRACVGGRDQVRKTWPEHSTEGAPESLIVTWPPIDGWTSPELEKLAQMASKAEHAVSRPRVALAWPKADAIRQTSAKRYCYLPTQVSSPLGIDVHADFQLGIDRTTLKMEESDDVGRYNRALLEVAAELHLVCCLRFLGYGDDEIRGWTNWSWIKSPSESWSSTYDPANCRHDLWRFLNPKSSDDYQVQHLEQLLFGGDRNWRDSPEDCARWGELAAKFFSCPCPLHAFDDFWEATKAWIDRNPRNYGSTTKTWKQWANSICEALRRSKARVVPVLTSFDAPPGLLVSTREPLPDRPGSGGGRAERRLYIRRGVDDRADGMNLPEALRRRGRLITCYRFVDGINDLEGPNPTGALQLDRAVLLRELRQLPTNLEKWKAKALTEDAEEARRQQFELLQFAAELFVARFGTQQSLQDQLGEIRFFWRIEHHLGEEMRGAGRALATIFIPTRESNWQPARQLTQDEVCDAWLSLLKESVPGLNESRFLAFLGVAPSGQQMLLVEDGDSGIVSALLTPPELVEADTARIKAASLPLRWIAEEKVDSLGEAIRTAWPTWLAAVVRAENQGQTTTEVAKSLSDTAWYPVGPIGATPPIGADSTVAHLRPTEIVLEKDRRTKVLWTTSVESDRQMLAMTGAVTSLSDDGLRDNSAGPAIKLLKQIQRLDLRRVEFVPDARQGLLELFQSFLSAIATAADPSHEPLALLAYKTADKERPFPDRGLHWIITGDDGWIAEDNSQRELLRRFFPQLPVVCATLGPKVVKQLPWLSVRSIGIREQIARRPLDESATSAADRVRSCLDELLPALLAIAEVSRYTTQRINPQQVSDLWAATRLVQVANAWINYTVIGDGLEPITASWLEDSLNDVILDENLGIIFFDADKDSVSGPPLRAFGEALAARLLNDRRLGPAWSNALTEFEAGGAQCLDELLRKSGARTLCESYRRELRPLSAESHQNIVSEIQGALARIGSGLREPDSYSLTTRVLSPRDLVVPEMGWQSTTEGDIQACLDDAGWTDGNFVFKPEFQCREGNRQAWMKWLDTESRRLRLLILAKGLESREVISSRREAEVLVSTPEGQRLAASTSIHFSRLAFDPEATAREWLIATVTDLEHKLGDQINLPLDLLLPPITRYQLVSAICTVGAANWSRSTISALKPVEKALMPLTPDDRRANDLVKTEVGGDAEVALREMVVEQTAAILGDNASAWDLLSQSLPLKGVVRRKFEEARNVGGSLADALHVSPTWGSAGFDLIGLERDAVTGVVEVVRYEVKALPEAGARIRVFLSPNELAVYRKVVHNSKEEPANLRYRGKWRLVGVEPKGRAVDITEFLLPLLNETEGPLATLGRDGFAPEGLMLSISRERPDEPNREDLP